MSYSFRILFRLTDKPKLGIDTEKLLLTTAATMPKVTLHSKVSGVTIKDSRELIMQGEGYNSDNNAQTAGEHFRNAMALACARVRIGADFGTFSPKGIFTKHGLQMLGQPLGQRVLNEALGLSVFKTDPLPFFVESKTKDSCSRSGEAFKKALSCAVEMNLELSEQERLSFDLFSASFFQVHAETRFLMLMMAIETLLEPAPRPDIAMQHIDELIRLTKNSTTLSQSEKDSFLGSLQWLYKDSIGQTGRKLAQKLKGRKYMNRKPENFFTYSYDLRSKLIHGNAHGTTRKEVGTIVSNLESFIGDLLCGPLLEMTSV